MHDKYGKVVKFWMGAELYFSFADIADIQEVHRQSRGRPKLAKILLPFLGEENLLFQPTADDHGKFVKALRLKYGMMVNGREAGETVHRISLDMFKEKAAHWGSGKPIDVYNDLKVMLYDLMGIALFGQAWMDQDVGREIFRLHRYCIEWSMQMGIKAMKHPTVGNILRSGSDYFAYQRAIRDFQALCWKMIESRRAEIEANPAKFKDDTTALTLLVTEKVGEDGLGGSPGASFFTKARGIATCAGFLNGAYDTTHVTLFWILYHLARYPEAQAKLAAEIDAEVGGDLGADPTFEQCKNCPYLHAVIQESLRCQPTVPVNMRENDAEINVNGTTVPAGSSIIPYTVAAFKDAAAFGPEPGLFRPERFLGDGAGAKKARSSFAGFGSHSRMCVGFKFAEAELKAILTHLVQRYTVGLADPDMAEPPVMMESGVTAPVEKFKLTFEERR